MNYTNEEVRINSRKTNWKILCAPMCVCVCLWMRIGQKWLEEQWPPHGQRVKEPLIAFLLLLS